jgi:molybdate transport system ATP-binding protein
MASNSQQAGTMANPIATSSPSEAVPYTPALSAHFRKSHTRDTEFTLEVDFSAPAGFTIVFGASGAGKTTLLDCIAGLANPDSGAIRIGTRVLFDAHAGTNVPLPERRVGYVFQDLALFPHLTVERNVGYGLNRLERDEREKRIGDILDTLRIRELRLRRPNEVSGGERQRVALARSLVTDPCILLLDEPLAALDSPTKGLILDDLRRWNEAHRIPILYVTHSREEVFALGERVLVLDRGRVLAQGTPHDVMTAPRQETIAQLAGFENIFDAVVSAAHEDRGTMTCHLAGSNVELETPLVRTGEGSKLRIGIRAGDILLATQRPQALSARNLLPGKIISLVRRDVLIVARIEIGVEMEVHLTLAARDALELSAGREVWLVVKTHSCHLMSA